MHKLKQGPLARRSGLTVEIVGRETVVYDHERHRVHLLNAALAFIWQQCDGKTALADIASRLPDGVHLPADPDVVRSGLRKLSRIHLIQVDSIEEKTAPVPSRRELVRRMASVGVAAAALLPAVTSLTAPTPAMAQSQDSHEAGSSIPLDLPNPPESHKDAEPEQSQPDLDETFRHPRPSRKRFKHFGHES